MKENAQLEVVRCTLADVEQAPNLQALLAEYAAESANEQIGSAKPHLPTYRAMEAAGIFHAIAARIDGELVGFMFILTPVLPHFCKVVAVSESYFVAVAYRKSGAGLRLLREAERVSKEAGAVGLLVTAPIGGILEQVLPGVDYSAASTAFFKRLA